MFSEFGTKVINNQTLNMKSKTVLTILICLLSTNVFGQISEKGKVGFSYSFGGVSLISKKDFSKELTAKSSSSVGLVYLHPLKQGLELESGLTYSLFNYIQKADPEVGGNDFDGNISVIDIPIGVRATFGKYFFINGGGLIDFTATNSVPISSQSGIGLYGGLGVVADFDFGGSLFLNPYIKLHSLIPFGNWKEQDRIFETLGVKIGFTYKL